MRVKSLVIGNLQIKNNIFLAPMAGYTDYCFRKLMIDFGIGLTFTELVSAKGLKYGTNGSKELLFCGEDYSVTSAQLFGSDEAVLEEVAKSEDLKRFSLIDINMGCPVPKVFKNGEGSALLKDILKAEKVIKALVKSGKTITVKIRKGLIQSDDFSADFAKMAENSGANAITIHGRSREEYYTGEPDYKSIENAKKSVKIPVIANGGIFTESDADMMLDRTGADGIMIARGALADPFLIHKLLGTEPKMDLKEFMLLHLSLMKDRYGEQKSAIYFRKFAPYYLKGIPDIKKIKTLIQTCNNYNELSKIISDNF